MYTTVCIFFKKQQHQTSTKNNRNNWKRRTNENRKHKWIEMLTQTKKIYLRHKYWNIVDLLNTIIVRLQRYKCFSLLFLPSLSSSFSKDCIKSSCILYIGLVSMDLINQFGIQLIQFTNVSWNHTDNTKYFKHYLESSLFFRSNQVAVFFFENLNIYFM